MFAQPCKYTLKMYISCFKNLNFILNCVVYELFHDKAVKGGEKQLSVEARGFPGEHTEIPASCRERAGKAEDRLKILNPKSRFKS